MAKADIKDVGADVADAAQDLNDAVHSEARDNVRQFQASAQNLRDAVNDAIGKAADSVAAAAVRIGDQAKDAYGTTTDRVQHAADIVDPLVKEKPYAAVAIAAVAGIVLGLLMTSRGPKVIYVKPREH
jgi:ElaB/YqjD/DUF883 family membrane-anchored ribosome-binding protein